MGICEMVKMVVKDAPDALELLWEEKTFTKALNMKEIEQELGKRGYNFTDKNLMMTLKRAKFLTRRGDRGSYAYIQKYPYFKEAKE